MDYLEALDLCAYDVEEAHRIMTEGVDYTPELMAEIMEESCVDRVEPKPGGARRR